MSQSSRITSAPLAVFLVLCASLALAGCGDSMSGTYSADGAAGAGFAIEFKPGNKAAVTVMGMSKEGTYAVKGDKVTVTIDKNPAVFVKQKDGSLQGQGEMAVTLKKK